MSSKEYYESYDTYLATLERENELMRPVSEERRVVLQASGEVLESLVKAEQHLDTGTEEGLHAALNVLRALFSVVDTDELQALDKAQ